MRAMHNDQHDDQRLARLRSGLLSAEEALALNEELEREDSITAATTGSSSAMRARLKAIRSEDDAPLSHFEELCYKELEGELTLHEAQELEEICRTYSRYAQIRTAILQTRLVAPSDIVYPHKERLKRHEPIVAPLFWKAVAAAACLLLFVLLGGNWFDYQPQTPIVAEFPSSKPTKRIEAITPDEVPAQSVATKQATKSDTPSVAPAIALPMAEQGVEQSGQVTASVGEPLPALMPLLPLPTLDALSVLRQNDALLIASKTPDLDAFHDWETIMLEDDVAEFEEQMQELHENLPKPERPFGVKFIDFVITQLAQL